MTNYLLLCYPSLLSLIICFNWWLPNCFITNLFTPLIIGITCFYISYAYFKNDQRLLDNTTIKDKRYIYLLIIISIIFVYLLKFYSNQSLIGLAVSLLFPLCLTPLWTYIIQQLIYHFKYKTILIIVSLLSIALIINTTYIPLVSIDPTLFSPKVTNTINQYAILWHCFYPVMLIVLAYGYVTNHIAKLKLNYIWILFIVESLLIHIMGLSYPYLYRFCFPIICIYLVQNNWINIKIKDEAITIIKFLVMIGFIPIIYSIIELYKSYLKLLDNPCFTIIVSSGFILLITYIIYHLPLSKPIDSFKRATIRINSNALKHNIDAFNSLLPSTTNICAVLKGNAYGHNAPLIASICQQNGIDMMAVACLKEAIELRKKGIECQLLILSDSDPINAKLISKYQCIQTISSLDTLIKYQNSGYIIHTALAIDTGMHRLGFEYDDHESLSKAFAQSNICIDHIYSHLSDSEDLSNYSTQYTYEQINRFNECITYCKSLAKHSFTTSLQASFGTLNYASCNYDYVRLGIALYGVTPDINQPTRSNLDLQPVLSLHSKIIGLHKVNKGDTIGYGQLTIAQHESLIATISIGYVDGLFRNYQDTQVVIHGKKAPVIGKICMDLCMVDVTDIDNVSIQDEVEFISANQDAPTLAKSFNTNSVELLARLSKRLDVTVIQ